MDNMESALVRFVDRICDGLTVWKKKSVVTAVIGENDLDDDCGSTGVSLGFVGDDSA